MLSKIAVNTCRAIVAATFIFSGFVKAVDPLGTQYKLADYAEAWHLGGLANDYLLICMAVALAAIEFTLGICLLFAIHRRVASKTALALMLVMTPLTLWLAIDNPISDCGCFGDAVKLTNWQTFGKNVVLLAAAGVVAWRPLLMDRFISLTNQWIVVNFSLLFIAATSLWSLYTLPQLDFRPYTVGTDLRKAVGEAEEAAQPQFETTFILEKEGERREFTLDDYPDSTWTFIDSKTVETSSGELPAIHDFSIERRTDGDDITEEILQSEGYTFLLIAPHLETADDSQLDQINGIYEYAEEMGYPFYCLTASGDEATAKWTEMTGAEYPFCTTDETTLKTIVRSNPGLLLLHDGTITGKWSHNRLPSAQEFTDGTQADADPQPLDRLDIGKPHQQSMATSTIKMLLWYVLPLLALTIADRTWAWTRWLKRRRKRTDKKEEESKQQ